MARTAKPVTQVSKQKTTVKLENSDNTLVSPQLLSIVQTFLNESGYPKAARQLKPDIELEPADCSNKTASYPSLIQIYSDWQKGQAETADPTQAKVTAQSPDSSDPSSLSESSSDDLSESSDREASDDESIPDVAVDSSYSNSFVASIAVAPTSDSKTHNSKIDGDSTRPTIHNKRKAPPSIVSSSEISSSDDDDSDSDSDSDSEDGKRQPQHKKLKVHDSRDKPNSISSNKTSAAKPNLSDTKSAHRPNVSQEIDTKPKTKTSATVAAPAKQVAKEPLSEASSDSDSDSDSDSGSGTSNDSDGDASEVNSPTKAISLPKVSKPGAISSSSVDSDSSSESDSIAESSSDGDSKSGSGSGSGSDSDSDSDSNSDSDSDSNSIDEPTTSAKAHTLAVLERHNSQGSGSNRTVRVSPDPTAIENAHKGTSDTQTPQGASNPEKREQKGTFAGRFRRVPANVQVDPRFGSNKYVSYDYADRAHQDLIVTKGKGFTKEKNKKKRGSYRGGMIDTQGLKGIKFED